MKHLTKAVYVCLSAVLFCGCLPQEKLTGRVIGINGPVSGAAVLGMVWIEDADTAKPVPVTDGLKQDELDAALEKDVKERGLPVAYARAFTDENGQFSMDKVEFSVETGKAVKAMKQPKVTRITLNTFQRGYMKQATTLFPRNTAEDISPAIVILHKPESWKKLALDNYFGALRRDEYDQGYSKAFGATKEEKEWFLEYTKGNLGEAYAESNIKGDKQWEEDCGRDFSDVIVSTAGMQRNPEREKCNVLLRQMGVLGEWKEEWLSHTKILSAGQTPAESAVKTALAALGSEYAEVKANEAQILNGVAEAEEQRLKYLANKDLRNGLNDSGALTVEAQQLYLAGDKTKAYKTIGAALFSQLPADTKKGIITALLPASTIPGITDTVAGFYSQLNRPRTAQLPGGDGGNHKDKPGYKIEAATETPTSAGKQGNSQIVNNAHYPPSKDKPKAEIEKSSETSKEEGSRIILAESEIVVMRDGTELSREFVQEGSKKADQIFEEVSAANSRGGEMRIENHVLKEPKLKFYGNTGKLTKELRLGEMGQDVIRKKHALLSTEKLIQRRFKAEAWVSENEKRALFVESVQEYELEDDGKKKKLSLGTTSDYKYFSSDGRLLFEKQLPPAYSVWQAAISESGKVVVVVKSCEMPDWECPGPGEEEDSLIVYDETGKKLMGHPSALTNLDISPNGKYLSACRGDEILFFNTESKKVWKTESELAVRNITNAGKAQLSKSQGEGKKSLRVDLDLTKYLGD